MSTIQRLTKKQLIKPPSYVVSNCVYETMMGSIAYGVATDDSDVDVYGFCIPSKEVVFPHLTGEILGFGRQHKRFDQYQQHHVFVQDDAGGKGKTYDLSIYNIVRYFHLCMENNPNMIDSLFTPQDCILHITPVGNLVRDNRKIFLHKGAWHKFRGYSFSQLHKMSGKNPIGKRVQIREQYGFDVKFAMHVVRLLHECEDILTDGDIDLRKHREHLKAVRRGEVSEQDIRDWFTSKEKYLERLYESSKLPHSPPEGKIKQLLLDCLEHHYGNLSNIVPVFDAAQVAIMKIQAIIDMYRGTHA